MKPEERSPVDKVIWKAQRVVLKNAYLPKDVRDKYKIKVFAESAKIVKIKKQK